MPWVQTEGAPATCKSGVLHFCSEGKHFFGLDKGVHLTLFEDYNDASPLLNRCLRLDLSTRPRLVSTFLPSPPKGEGRKVLTNRGRVLSAHAVGLAGLPPWPRQADVRGGAGRGELRDMVRG